MTHNSCEEMERAVEGIDDDVAEIQHSQRATVGEKGYILEGIEHNVERINHPQLL